MKFSMILMITIVGVSFAFLFAVGMKVRAPQKMTAQKVVATTQENDAIHIDRLPVAEDMEEPLDIFAIGDIMLGRYVQTLMERNGHDYVFAKITDELHAHDIVVANLEGPIMDGAKTPDDSLIFRFQEYTAPLLARHNITHVSLANNHTLNQGRAGLENTRSILRENNIHSFGDPEHDGAFVLWEEYNDVTIAWIGANATVRTIDDEAVARAIINARTKADIIILSVHWGNEYQHTPSVTQTTLAHTWIDAGADMILGHHPHVIQSVEIYHDRVIFYSLGNFIFDQYFSQDTQEMLGIDMEITDTDIIYSIVPITSVKTQPTLALNEPKQGILNKLADWSDNILHDAIINGIIILKR